MPGGGHSIDCHLHFAGRDPYGGASDLVILNTTGTAAAAGNHRAAGRMERSRFAELLHIRWLLEFGASGKVANRCSAASRMSMKWPHALLPASYFAQLRHCSSMSAKR